jgi:prophage regulatory protein
MEFSMSPRAIKNPRRPATLPAGDDGLLRVWDVLDVVPVGESTWHKGVAEGRYPQPVRLSERIVAWRVSDIRKLLAAGDNAERHAPGATTGDAA